MHVRSFALVAVVSMLAALGCSKAPAPLTEPATLLSEAQSGGLDMAIFSGEGAARQVQSAKGCTGKKKYSLQYVFSDIDHIRVTVSSTLLATPLVRDVNCTTEFVGGRGHIRFASLLAGAYQIRVEAYLADGTLIGTQLLDVTVVAGRTVVVAVSIQLTDTHVVSTTHGHLGANITFVNGTTVADVIVDADHDGFPLITGECVATPTPTPDATPTPTGSPSASPTPNMTAGSGLVHP